MGESYGLMLEFCPQLRGLLIQANVPEVLLHIRSVQHPLPPTPGPSRGTSLPGTFLAPAKVRCAKEPGVCEREDCSSLIGAQSPPFPATLPA